VVVADARAIRVGVGALHCFGGRPHSNTHD
jgi:hypothetical protein